MAEGASSSPSFEQLIEQQQAVVDRFQQLTLKEQTANSNRLVMWSEILGANVDRLVALKGAGKKKGGATASFS